MTDKEIIKALECCTLSKQICPKNCPLANDRGCMVKVKENALDLINRQEAEIERLKDILIKLRELHDRAKGIIATQNREIEQLKEDKHLDKEIKDYPSYLDYPLHTPKSKERNTDKPNDKHINTPFNHIKAESVKEFVERLKKDKTTAISLYKFTEVVRVTDIDNLLKEMVGDGNDTTRHI